MGFLQMVIATGSVIVQFVTNGFGDKYVSAQVTGAKIENFIVQVVLSLGSAVAVFASQNYGAKKPERMKKVLLYTTLQAIVMGFISATLLTLCSDLLISLYLPADAEGREAIVLGVKTIIGVMLYSYIINAVDSTFNAVTKSLGHTFVTMTSGIICICGVRAIWILGIFPHIGTLRSVYLVYPISYTVSTVATIVAFLIIFGRANREMLAERAAKATSDAVLLEKTDEVTAASEK
jgi:Na+-driven multidrug efflux pump